MTRKEQIAIGTAWFQQKGWTPFPFQVDTWKRYLQGKSGIVNAATGSGKTYALIVPILLEASNSGGIERLINGNLGVRNGVYTYKGCLTNEYLGERFQMKSTDLNLLLTSNL